MESLQDFLDKRVRPADLVTEEGDGTLRCTACALRCRIEPGKRGVCQVRFNRDDVLLAPHGYVAALQLDPIEKKPFNHVTPGAAALTFGMLGCDLHCEFCQNWVSSQALRDPAAKYPLHGLMDISPEQLAELAVKHGAEWVISSYNEPLITAEWAKAVFEACRARGVRTGMVSNGNATREVLEYLAPVLDIYKVDLKAVTQEKYRRLGGSLKVVQETIRALPELGVWLEVVTLVIPRFNDSPEELWEAAQFLAGVSKDIPWHVTAFHPDYKMDDVPPTSAETLKLAAEIGEEAGLRYVYAGNLPGRVGSLEDTRCPKCLSTLVSRRGHRILANRIVDGKCPECGTEVRGVWE